MSRTLCGVDLAARVGEFPEGVRTPICVACGELIEPDDVHTLVRVGPGADPVQRERARRGEHYIPVWVPVHWGCATGEEE